MTGGQPEFRLLFNPNESETNYAWSYGLCARSQRETERLDERDRWRRLGEREKDRWRDWVRGRKIDGEIG